jgi:hypothetical protein
VRVKVALGPPVRGPSWRTLAAGGRQRGGLSWKGHGLMADLAFAVLLIVAFSLLVFVLRGLEKL